MLQQRGPASARLVLCPEELIVMKFNCGETAEQRRIRKRVEREQNHREFVARMERWHDKFAWLPIRLNWLEDGNPAVNTCVWLEWIERKGTYKPEYYAESVQMWIPASWKWEYREPERRSNYY